MRLPDHETFGSLETVAVVEAEHAVLGQRTVDETHRRLLGREMLQGNIFLARAVIMQDRMTMTERAALRVLSADAHGMLPHGQRGEGQ